MGEYSMFVYYYVCDVIKQFIGITILKHPFSQLLNISYIIDNNIK